MPLSIVTAGLSMGKHWAKEVACLAGAWKQRAQERKYKHCRIFKFCNVADILKYVCKKERSREEDTRVS